MLKLLLLLVVLLWLLRKLLFSSSLFSSLHASLSPPIFSAFFLYFGSFLELSLEHELGHWKCVLVYSMIAYVSTCHEYVSVLVLEMSQQLSTASARVFIGLHLKTSFFLFKWTGYCGFFWTVRSWETVSSLEPLPALLKIQKQEGLVNS